MKNADLPYVQVAIDCRELTNWDSYHDAFAAAFGFPDFYGRNMNAWIDCLTSLDVPDDGLTTVHAPHGGSVVLRIPRDGEQGFHGIVNTDSRGR